MDGMRQEGHEGREEGGGRGMGCSVIRWYEVVWRGGGWVDRRQPWRAAAGEAARHVAGLSAVLRPVGFSPVSGSESEFEEIIRPLFCGKSNETR